MLAREEDDEISIQISHPFIATSCAAGPNVLDWSKEVNLIVFGSSNNLFAIKPQTTKTAKPPQIVATGWRHHKQVTSVRWIKQGSGTSSHHVISCSADKSCILWEYGRQESLHTLKGHNDVVSFACGLQTSPGSFLVASSSADSSIKIWMIEKTSEKDIGAFQTIDLYRGFAFAMDLFTLKNGNVLLASGHDDFSIKLHIQHPVSKDFCLVQTLTGHTDWIRSLSFKDGSDGQNCDILLASSSQDTFVRLWRISEMNETDSGNAKDSNLIQVKPKMFQVQNLASDDHTVSQIKYSVSLDAVLEGHEDRVYSVRWKPGNALELLTSSMDKCLILWEPDKGTGIWLEKARMGEVGGQAAGYYGAVYSPSGAQILGHSYQGGLHQWDCQVGNGCIWEAKPVPSGHFKPVQDVAWSPDGGYLVSCSADQTTRIYGPWKNAERGTVTYHEIGRPQVHGHDLQCLAIIDKTKFVSGAEEKILRSFLAPKSFVQLYCNISGIDIDNGFCKEEICVESASLPALGLSNKAEIPQEKEKESIFEPPTEDRLMQSTLWPETHKLYGHGQEIFCVSANHAGTWIASACKASQVEHASILLWSTADWQLKQKLPFHSLTVTEIRFSPCDKYLLTVSRDRTWSLRMADANIEWKKIGNSDKNTGVHSRIIWGCGWSHDSKFFFTSSRDKKVVAWLIDESSEDPVTGPVKAYPESLTLADSVTCIDSAPKFMLENPKEYLFAVGQESGEIVLCAFHGNSGYRILQTVSALGAHSGCVKKIKFRPITGDWGGSKNGDQQNLILFASAGEDNCVKVFSVKLTT